MTIRDYLKRRTRLLFVTAFAGWLVCASSLFFVTAATRCHAGCGHHAPPLPFFIGVPLFGGALVGLMFFTKCPRCAGRLGQIAASTALKPHFLSRPINFCPYCGVSLDERYRLP